MLDGLRPARIKCAGRTETERGGDAAPPDLRGYDQMLEPVAHRERSAPKAGYVMQVIVAAIGNASVFF